MNSGIFFNRTFNKNHLKDIIQWTFQHYGSRRTIELSERLKNLSFRLSAKVGISLGIKDFLIPKEKCLTTRISTRKIKRRYVQRQNAGITQLEINQTLIRIWGSISENFRNIILEIFDKEDPLNPLYLIAFSGARGNLTQARQLIGIRGLMVDPLGRVVESPIHSSFKESLTLTEFILSCYGARKGVLDTALGTKTAGYLTRRLIDIVHFLIIGIRDCGTQLGIHIFSLMDLNENIVVSYIKRRKGRFFTKSLYEIGLRNFFPTQTSIKILENNYSNIIFRSTLVCRATFLTILTKLSMNRNILEDTFVPSDVLIWKVRKKNIFSTICQYCHGQSSINKILIPLGEAIGITAAQSIGEPGTQLTIRTFHTGGVFSGGIQDTLSRPMNGKVFFPRFVTGRLVRSNTGKIGLLVCNSFWIYLKSNIVKFQTGDTFKFSSHFISQKKKITKKLFFLEQKIFVFGGTLIFIRIHQWITKSSNLGFRGPNELISKQELQVRIFKTPRNRELIFEEVYLKGFFPFTKTKILKKKKSVKFQSPRFPIESIKRIRIRDFSRILLRNTELYDPNHKFVSFPYNNRLIYNPQKNFDFIIRTKQLNHIEYNLYSGVQFSFINNIYIYCNSSIIITKTKYINFFVREKHKTVHKIIDQPFFTNKTKIMSHIISIYHQEEIINFNNFLTFYRYIVQRVRYSKNQWIYQINLKKIKSLIYKYYKLITKIIFGHFFITNIILIMSEKKMQIYAEYLNLIPKLRNDKFFFYTKKICKWNFEKIHMFLKFLINKESKYLFYRNVFIFAQNISSRRKKIIICFKFYTIAYSPKQFKNYKNKIILYYWKQKTLEILENFVIQETFFLFERIMKIYIHLLTKRSIFLGFLNSIPSNIIGKIGSLELRKRLIFNLDILLLRKRTRIRLESDRFFPWPNNTTLQVQKPFIAILGRITKIRDITSRIPQIESLLEVRTKTILRLLVVSLYKLFIKKNNSNRIATRKVLHFRQRTIIDRIQRIYYTNNIFIDTKYLELIICPIAFIQIIPIGQLTCFQRNKLPFHEIIQERFPVEIVERINWNYMLKNWRKKEFLNVLQFIVLYKPILKGLTESSLKNYSFLSAASFQTATRVLAHAALLKQHDYLRGLKENLIMGTCIPIGMNVRLFHIKNDVNLKSKYKPKYNFEQKNNIYQNPSVFWWFNEFLFKINI